MRPLSNHLIVRRLPERKPEGGILIPEAYAESMQRGDTGVYDVLAVGPGKHNWRGVLIPLECEAGDRVICYSRVSGPEPLDDGRMVIDYDQVIAVIPKQNNP